VTSLASLSAGLAVQDEAYVRHAIALNNERRDRMQTSIQNLGIFVYSSASNFLLLRLPAFVDCQQLWECLIRKHHIVTRNCANYEGFHEGHLRVAVRTDPENERLVEALACEVRNKQ
jgi:threonine-phosphate decarboxylase